MTYIGTEIGWRTEFVHWVYWSSLLRCSGPTLTFRARGEKLTKANSPLAVLKIPGVLLVLLLTFLSVTAHYGAYTYITLLVREIAFPGGITSSLADLRYWFGDFGCWGQPRSLTTTCVKSSSACCCWAQSPWGCSFGLAIPIV